jgi:hypothetical protein
MDNGLPPPAHPLDDRPFLICVSHLRWNFVYQRPQHLLARAAARYRVIYFEEPVFTDAARSSLISIEQPEGVTVVTPHLPRKMPPEAVSAALKQLLAGLFEGDTPQCAVAWYYTPMALQFTSALKASVCVYDNMDELSSFRGASPLLLELEDELLTRASVVFTGGRSLYEAKKHRHTNIHAFPSSIDMAHFAEARHPDLAEASDQISIARPRIGFFGVIDERMDLDLVARAAALRANWQFVMIGPVVKIDPASLPGASNIHWLGQRTYAELPAYLKGWDLGFMPFALNEATRFISPTKTPEFLAAGLRVISTPIEDVVRPYGEAGLVYVVRTAEEFVLSAQRLLGDRPHPAWHQKVDRFLGSSSWNLTWANMNYLIDNIAGSSDVFRRDVTTKGEARV